MIRFYAGAFSLLIGQLERAWLALTIATSAVELIGPPWDLESAWGEVDKALRMAHGILEEHQFPEAIRRHLARTEERCRVRHPANAIGASTALQELSASICDLLRERVYFQIDPSQTRSVADPVARWGQASTAFPEAKESMVSAVRCLALDEWDASVFHGMRVLEKGLRWLAAKVNAGPFPLTLKKPVEFENWENIIGNIQARIDEELESSQPRTPERLELLAFYSESASEFRYFKDAWRNHLAHDRNAPYDVGTAGSVIGHVETFMQVLAKRR